jgi:hypothetical protein
MAAQNQFKTRRNSAFEPFTIWFDLKSAIEYSPVPHRRSCKNAKKKENKIKFYG